MKKLFQSKAVPRGTRTIWRYLGALFILFTFAIGNVWADEVKLVSEGTTAISKIAGTGTAPSYLGTIANPAVYESGDKSYSVSISTNFSVSEGSEYKPDGSTKYKDYYYNANAACDMSTTPTNYIKVAATGCKISKIVVRVECFNSTPACFPAVGFIEGLPETTTIGSKTGRRVDTLITSQSGAYNSSKRFEYASTLTYTFSTNVSEVYFSKQIKAIAQPNESSVSSQPSSSQTSGVFGIDVYVVPNAPACTKPGTPGTPSVSSKTHNTANLTWTAAGNSDGYKVSIVKKSDASVIVDWTDCATNSYAASGLDPETTYTFKVKAKGATGYCELGDEASADFATEVDPSATTYKVTLVPAGGTISDATGWTLNAGNYEKEVSDGTELALPTFTKENRTFKTWRKAGPTDVTSPITVTADVTLTAVWNATVEQVIYSWESPDGTAVEVGGTAITKDQDGNTVEGNGNVNATLTNVTVAYKAIMLNGKISSNAWSGNYIQITTDEAVKAGDKVKVTACTTKGDTSKKGSAQMRAGSSATSTAIFTDGNSYNDILADGTLSPNTKTFTVPDGVNTSTLTMTRSQSSTNCWVTKLQIVREVLVEEANIRTVTFNYNDGVTANVTVEVASGATVSAPADPTRAHYRFHEWQLGGVAYDFATAVTSNITLVADWIQLYTITFAAGDGSGDAPAAIADKAQGETFAVPANTFTAPEGKEFDKWNDGSADYAPDDTYTVGTDNVVLTAQWKALVAKYTVIFKDGETTLDTKLFDVGTNPSDAGVDKTKPLYTFAAWQKDASDIAFDDAFWATVVKDATVTLTARWAKAYASNADFEAYIIANTSEKDDSVKADTYVKSLNYALSKKLGTTFDANTSSNNGAYAGLKIKNSGTVLSWNVVAGKVVELKAGVMVANGSLAINGGAATEIDGGSTGSGDNFKIHYFYSATEALYEFTTSNGSAEVIKAITMRDPFTVSFEAHGDADPSALQGLPFVTLPDATNGTASLLGWFDAETGGNKIGDAGATYIPTANITLHAQWEAISTDNTLSDLKVGGVTVDGFSPAVHTYYVVLPYGTAVGDIPAISATANSAKAKQVAIQQAVWAGDPYNCYRAQANVQAEDESWGYYDVRFSFAPKDGVCLVKANVGNNTITIDEEASLYTGNAYNVNVKSESSTYETLTGWKMNTKGCYVGIELDEQYSFQEGDVFEAFITTVAGDGTNKKLYVFSDHTTSDLASVLLATSGEDQKQGVNKAVLPDSPGKKVYMCRGNDGKDYVNQNPYVAYIAVYRAMNPMLKAMTINGANVVIDEEHKTATVAVPYDADLANLTIDPTIVWNAPAASGSIVVNNGSAWTEGENTYKLTDKDGDATTYTITLSKAPHYVAQIGETKYTSLDDAVTYANANAGSEIVLLESITRDDRITLTANTTLNLNGYTFGKTNGGWLIFVKGGATLTIDGESASSAVYGGISLGASTNNNGSLVLNGGTYSCGENTACIHINGTCLNSNVTINGATITNAYDNAIQFNGKGVFTITDATITGATGIYIKSGEMTITNSTVTGTMAPANYSYNGNGANPTGDGIVVDACNYPGGAPTINIVSGTFSGTKSAIGNYNYQGTSEPAVGGITGGTFSTAVPAELCAEGYAPTSWTVGTETKYGVHLLGVIRAAAAQDANHGNAYAVTLDNGVVVISSNSDGKFDTNNQFDNSAADAAVALGADEGKYRYKGQHMLLKFPVNVNEFTIYSYDNNTTDRKINKVTVGDDPENVKLKNNDAIGTYTFTNNTTTKLRTMTATMTDDEIIASDKYVYVGLSNAHTVFRILYTEAPCIDPVINSIDATRMKVGEQATVSVDASAVGATYQWYRCSNAAGDNAAIITGATAASYSFTKAAGDEYFKVVVGCNCNDVKVEAVVKAEEWYEVIRTNVTGYTEWSWNGVYDNETAGPTINQAQKGLVLASYIDAPNFDKLEGNDGAYVYRKNQYPAFQGTQLKFTAEVPGMLIIDASYTDNGNTFSVNGYPMGTLPKNHAKDTIAVKAGDVTITSQGIRIWAMTFDPDFSNYALTDNKASGYTRDVTEGRYGTICLPNGGVMVGAALYEVAYFDASQKKIFFDEVLNGEMVAGRPYIFLPEENVSALGVYYTDAANAAAGSYHGLFGSYTKEPLAQDAGNYILYNNQYLLVNSANVYVGENRAYIKIGGEGGVPTNAVAPAPGRRRVAMGVLNEQVVTGVDELNASEAPVKVLINGQMFILRGEKMYDTTGRLVK